MNWKREIKPHGPTVYRTTEQDDFALVCADHELAIATPGLTKHGMVGEDFRYLWQRAEEALVGANAVVFVGYRFPPTDSEALRRLAGAIGRNDTLHLALHTVLGPRSDDDTRLRSLLRFAARARTREHTSKIGVDAVADAGKGGLRLYTLVSQGLWAQDFLLLAQPHEVSQPYMIRWE